MTATGPRPRLPDRADRVGLDGVAGARHERRPEDDGRHHAGPDRQRHGARQTPPPRSGSSCPARLAISLGTYLGGWRVIRTLGKGLVEIESPQGMAAESASAAVILLSSSFGYSLSTTHVATGSIIGTGLGKKGAEVRWNVAGRMATAWLFTLPCAGLVGAGAEFLAHAIGGTRRGDRRPGHPGRGRGVDLLAVPHDQGRPQQRQRRSGPGRSRRPSPSPRQRLSGGGADTCRLDQPAALWKILVFGLVAGAGLPALFAIGLLALSKGPKTAAAGGRLRRRRRRQPGGHGRGRVLFPGRAGRHRLGYLRGLPNRSPRTRK